MPTNATAPSYTWSTSNANVATVSGGTVTAVAAGNATITVSDGNGHTATCTVTVVTSTSPYINGVAYKYKLINNGDSSYAGTYYFTGEVASTYYGKTSSTYSSGVYLYFETNGSGQNIYFMSGSTKKYLYIALSGTHINFKFDTSTAPSSPWYYDVTTQQMYFEISSEKYVVSNYGTYTNMAANTLSSMTYSTYFEDTAEVFSHKFLNRMTCDASGEERPEFDNGYSWNDFSTLYSALNVDVEQASLKNATANESGTIVQKAMARYDYICVKYGSSVYNNFIGRTSANASNENIFKINNNNAFIIIVCISSIALMGFGCYFFLRKKKISN